MTVRLPAESRTLVAASPDAPVELRDEATHRTYVLIPAEEFERLKNRFCRRPGRHVPGPSGIGHEAGEKTR